MMRNDVMRRVLLLVALSGMATGIATAQESSVSSDSVRVQIQTRLRAFYFNLAHHDWEALTADILAAKVVAHRPPPDALLVAALSRKPIACSSGPGRFIENARIMLDGDWAEVSVPRCTSTLAGSDEFRFIHFEARWRLVYIRLFEESLIVSA